jgi:hypothetical protein
MVIINNNKVSIKISWASAYFLKLDGVFKFMVLKIESIVNTI